MAADAGERTGEAPADVSRSRLCSKRRLDDLADAARVTVAVDSAAHGRRGRARAAAGARAALRGIVKNALEAGGAGEVRVAARAWPAAWRLVVRDRGPGMPPDVLAHAGEPFFTTKNGDGLGRGMGLGLFLARVVLERLGGALEIDSALGRGTTVTLVVPAGEPAAVGRSEDPAPPSCCSLRTGA